MLIKAWAMSINLLCGQCRSCMCRTLIRKINNLPRSGIPKVPTFIWVCRGIHWLPFKYTQIQQWIEAIMPPSKIIINSILDKSSGKLKLSPRRKKTDLKFFFHLWGFFFTSGNAQKHNYIPQMALVTRNCASYSLQNKPQCFHQSNSVFIEYKQWSEIIQKVHFNQFGYSLDIVWTMTYIGWTWNNRTSTWTETGIDCPVNRTVFLCILNVSDVCVI